MFKIKKTFRIEGAHFLVLDYESSCQHMHGHSWKITVYCEGVRDKNGMVVDFSEITKCVKDKMDHKCLNDIFDFNPTAENIAYWICAQIKQCYKVDVQETEGNVATYVDGDFEKQIPHSDVSGLEDHEEGVRYFVVETMVMKDLGIDYAVRSGPHLDLNQAKKCDGRSGSSVIVKFSLCEEPKVVCRWKIGDCSWERVL